MTKFEKYEEVRHALNVLGVGDASHIADYGDRCRVHIYAGAESEYFGVYDFIRHTFVD